jgi:hypothetical protein
MEKEQDKPVDLANMAISIVNASPTLFAVTIIKALDNKPIFYIMPDIDLVFNTHVPVVYEIVARRFGDDVPHYVNVWPFNQNIDSIREALDELDDNQIEEYGVESYSSTGMFIGVQAFYSDVDPKFGDFLTHLFLEHPSLRTHLVTELDPKHKGTVAIPKNAAYKLFKRIAAKEDILGWVFHIPTHLARRKL